MEQVLDASYAAAIAVEQGRDLTQFDDVVRTHQRRIFRVLLAILRDPDAAETLTQECFLRAYKARTEFRGDASVATWLVRIAVNLARDHLRNRRASFWRRLLAGGEEAAATAVAVPDWRPTPEQDLATRQQITAVWQAAAELPPQQRTVFALRFVEEMSLAEIAVATSLRVGTVKAHLFRAIAAVRRRVRGQDQRE